MAGVEEYGPATYRQSVLVSADPEFTSEARLAVAKAVVQFNRGLYFESHETLEVVWLCSQGPSRSFFQALLQVSAGFHHVDRGNRIGALRTFRRALDRLEAYPVHYLGFDVGGERDRLTGLLMALEAGTIVIPGSPPTWSFAELPRVEGQV